LGPSNRISQYQEADAATHISKRGRFNQTSSSDDDSDGIF
jgi:hypothetical protein